MLVTTNLKQMEALFWIARLGTFERAAAKLNTTQSAVSKRIQDLEALSDEPVFDRSARSARLTVRGRALLALAEDMLKLRDEATSLLRHGTLPRGQFRLGVTEMTALTWLPALVAALRAAYPTVDVEPEVDSSEALCARLQNDGVDLIIVPDMFRDPRFRAVPVGSVNMSWMCSPRLTLPEGRLPLVELERMTILAQDMRSGSALHYRRWLEEQNVALSWKVSSNSLVALMGLTVSGLGVSYLPTEAAAPLVRSGQLRMLDIEPPLPPIPYAALMRAGAEGAYEAHVLRQAQATCDFTIPLWGRLPDA